MRGRVSCAVVVAVLGRGGEGLPMLDSRLNSSKLRFQKPGAARNGLVHCIVFVLARCAVEGEKWKKARLGDQGPPSRRISPFSPPNL